MPSATTDRGHSVDGMPKPETPQPDAASSARGLQWGRVDIGGVDLGDADVPYAHMPPPHQPLDVAIGDLDDLVSAVKARLRLAVDERRIATPESLLQEQTAVGRVRADVLECAAALDHLHATLTHELARRGTLELEVFDAQVELAQARAEIVGIQAGERRARHQAAHDRLTSLPNGGYFRERLDRALSYAVEQGQPLAVMYLDLDGFKAINDQHGHSAGDELLRIVAARLSRAVRAEDVVCRFGGDEFACLFVGFPGQEQLTQAACNIFDAISAPFQIGKRKLTVRPSIGVAMCPAHGVTSDVLLGNADAAMYRAKRNQTGHAFAEHGAEAPIALTEDFVDPVDGSGQIADQAEAPHDGSARGDRRPHCV